jgi:uncharacterized Zn-finger protein
MYKGKVYVSNSNELKNVVMKEMHDVPYVGHPRCWNKIVAVRSQYFWMGMKKEVANYISRCLECQKAKPEHRHPTVFLQPFPIMEWKWEVVIVYFITKLPRIVKKHDSIMVVVDKLTKETHFYSSKDYRQGKKYRRNLYEGS